MKQYLKGFCFAFCFFSSWIFPVSSIRGQISSDGTLPTPSSVTTTNNLDFIITNGSRAGNNLFHSFGQFSIPTAGSALFDNPVDVQNIFTRVTGKNISNIDGILKANGIANLFLINPSGIIFGPNAKLDIGGSFIASTANKILFDNGFEFSATNPETKPLLVINVPIGLQFGSSAQPISLQNSIIQGASNKTLAFLGGNVLLESSNLISPGGGIEIGSVAGDSLVRLIPSERGWIFGYENGSGSQDIYILKQSLIDVTDVSPLSGGVEFGSGDIQITGRNITIAESSTIVSATLGTRSAGNIILTASESIELFGTTETGTSTNINSATLGDGNAGNLVVTGKRLILRDGATITTGSDFFPGFNTQESVKGRSGNLDINVSELIEISGSSPTTGRSVLKVSTKTAGDAGVLNINTAKLIVRDGGQISASTTGSGNAGTLNISASELVEVSGTGIDFNSQTIPSTLVTASTSIGNAGNLTIKTGSLVVKDGALIDLSATGEGIAGNLEIKADSIININNQGKISAETATGDGGNISIQAGKSILLRNNSEMSTTAGGTGGGGDINIDTENLVLLENSRIIANAFEGAGGNISINTQRLFQSFDSPITASSQLGIDGLINFNNPEVDPGSGLVELPKEALNVDNKVAQACGGLGDLEGEFYITGKGGIASTPEDILDNESVLIDLGTPRKEVGSRMERADAGTRGHGDAGRIQQNGTSDDRSSQQVERIVEAQGWIVTADGRVFLTDQPSTISANTLATEIPNCRERKTSSVSSPTPTAIAID